jgi:hypothetical protein
MSVLEGINLLGHIASRVAPGTQLFDWYQPVDFTDLDMAPVVGQVWLDGMALDCAVEGSAVDYCLVANMAHGTQPTAYPAP